MKIERKTSDHATSGMMQVSKAKIRATAKVFSMFEDGTYTNKPVTIARELVANGIDSHIAAGIPHRPVEVTLPTEHNPTFVVRDFGIGMHRDFVTGPFMEYANGSTKEGSDEFVGGFGIGSKSPFSYVDQYTLRVVHNHILTVYVMFKDDEGIPAVGVLAESPTDEPNGVEVSFPVMEGDIEAFRAAAQTALMYFKPLPIVIGGEIHGPDYTYVGDNWGLRAQAGELHVIMGGVRYPVVTNSLEYSLRSDSDLGALLGYGLDITVPMGAVSIAMSREGLSYTDRTNAGVRAALSSVVKDVVATFATMFDNQPTLWKAIQRLHEETGGGNTYGRNARQQLMAANAYYKGAKLDYKVSIKHLNHMNFKTWEVPRANAYGKSRAAKTPTWKLPSEESFLLPGEIETVIVDDLPDSPKSKVMIKLKAFIEAAPRAKNILVIRAETRDNYDRIAELIGGAEFIRTSSLPEPATTAKAAKVLNVRPRVRMWTYDGQNERYSGRRATSIQVASHRLGVKEIKYADQPDTGIMVVMNSFAPPEKFYDKMDTGLVAFSELHFVNVGDWEKLDATKWQKFDDVFAARLANELVKWPDLAAARAVTDDVNYGNIAGVMRKLAEAYEDTDFPLTPAQLKRPFGRLHQLWAKYKLYTDSQHLVALMKFVEPKMPRGVNFHDLVRDFHAEQQDFVKVINFLAKSYYRMEKDVVEVLFKLA